VLLLAERTQVFMWEVDEGMKQAQEELQHLFFNTLRKVDEETNGKVGCCEALCPARTRVVATAQEVMTSF
jgi:hypothetical protein